MLHLFFYGLPLLGAFVYGLLKPGCTWMADWTLFFAGAVIQVLTWRNHILSIIDPPQATWQHVLLSCFSASGPTSVASCILAPLLPFVFRTMFSGLCWQLTCFTESLPSWWPCAFTATITFSSRSPRFLGRRVCQTARRKTPSTKINKLTTLSQSYSNCSSVELWNCSVSKCLNKRLFCSTCWLLGHELINFIVHKSEMLVSCFFCGIAAAV